MSSQGGSRSEYLIGKAGTEYITQKLTNEDPRVFLSQFQAAHGIAPANDTSFQVSNNPRTLLRGVELLQMMIEALKMTLKTDRAFVFLFCPFCPLIFPDRIHSGISTYLIIGAYLRGSAIAAWNLLDLMGESRRSSTRSLLQVFCSKLISRIDTMKEKELVEMLPMTYPYIGFAELRPVVVEILKRCQHIPVPLLQSLTEQLPHLQIKVPVEVMQQLWKFNEKTFIEAITPLIRAYLLQSASSWSVRAAQQLQKTRIEEYEQSVLRSSTVHMAATGEAVLTSVGQDMIAPYDLDLRQSWLSLNTVLISNPSSEILRLLHYESQSLGPSRNAFQTFVEAANSVSPDSSLLAELITHTTTKWEGQLKAMPQVNSYSASSSRDFNIPLQLLTDYIGDHAQLYTSAIRYVRRLMAEIQAFQLKLRPVVDFELAFPLLSSLGVLQLWTIYETIPIDPKSTNQASSEADPAHQQQQQETKQVPIGIDPSLSQILGSLRFDLLMTQHDRSHTSLCEQDDLYRYAWCMDAVRREKTVEQRHFDEMEEIFTLMQNQLNPLKKTASMAKNESAVSKASAEASSTTKSTKIVLNAKKSAGDDTSKRARPKRGSTAKEEIIASEPSADESSTRRSRSASARNAIKQATMDDDDFDADFELSVAHRPKRNATSKAKVGSAKKSYATMDDDLTDDEEDAISKPKRKKAKRESDEEDWSDAPFESDEDAGAKSNSGDEYIDDSDNGVEEDEEDDFAVEEEDEDYDDLIEDDAPKQRKKRTPANTRAKAKTTSSSGTTKSAGGSGLKVTLAGLTGASTLASKQQQASHSATKLSSSAGASTGGNGVASTSTSAAPSGGIKLKRGNQVLVDTASAQDAKPAIMLAAAVSSNDLDSRILLLSEVSWVTSAGSLQMTLQTMLYTLLKEISHRHSRPATVANCDPNGDVDAVKKIIISDKRISRLVTLLQLSYESFPVLVGDGLDSPTLVGLLAEKIIDSKILQRLLSNHLSSISTKPWTRQNVSPESLTSVDRSINLLAAICILTAYFERFESRTSSKEQINAGDDEQLVDQEEKRFEAMQAKSRRHQQASGDLIPDVRYALTAALLGLDEAEEVEEDLNSISIPSFAQPDAALSMVLFWSLTQAGSANEHLAREISEWVTTDSRVWRFGKGSVWSLLSYPTFIQELLFGFARAEMASPVLLLRPIMIEGTLANQEPGKPNVLGSLHGALQILSYVYLAMCHGSISREEAQVMYDSIYVLTANLDPSLSFVYLLDALKAAIEPMLIVHEHVYEHEGYEEHHPIEEEHHHVE